MADYFIAYGANGWARASATTPATARALCAEAQRFAGNFKVYGPVDEAAARSACVNPRGAFAQIDAARAALTEQP